mmetsp:Transcript_74783/g.134756  ORF Transcript_74783/g.134756 Transcript_74783/m.134756 type:complete len:551 (-) Transcript_74783:119-1771(-)
MFSLPDLQNGRERVRQCLVVYGVFGLTQVICRLLSSWAAARRMRRMLKDVPQARYKEGADGFISDILRNFHRIHDWRAEVSMGLPLCKLHGYPFMRQNHVLIVRDPLIIRHFLKDSFPKYTKTQPQNDFFAHYMIAFLGDGIFTALHGPNAPDKGKSWSLQRKIASQIFSRNNFNTLMQEVFQEKAEKLRTVLSQPCREGRAVDLQLHFFNFTMDSIMKIFFGEDSDSSGGSGSKYGQAFDVAHETFFEHALHSIPFNTMSSIFLPWPFGGAAGGYHGLAWRLRDALSPTYRKFRAAKKVLDVESRRLVSECRADPDLERRRDLLALFVQAEEREHFSTTFLGDTVLNMVIAGRDTTACALSWMFYELAKNPDVQRKLQAEIDERMPAGKHLTLKSLSHSEVPYLHGVLYETLRLWPPVPMDGKTATEDDVLPDGTPVPKYTNLLFLPYAMGRDPAVYPEPESLRPERWIPFTAPAPHEFPVFQAGPRICLGMDMALFEAKLVAVELLRHYSFELAPGQAERTTYGRKLTMAVSTGEKDELWMLVRSRRQ